MCTPVINTAGVGLGNPSSRYVETYFDKGFGEVFVLRAKLPTTPKTFDGEIFIKPYDEYDMRYFSICPQEAKVSWRVGKCLYDEDIPTDDEGYYTVAISTPSARPKNAIKKCGVAWTYSPPAGDGAGDVNLSNMWLRNMLPYNFTNAAQNVIVAGTEQEVMGDYYPIGTYYTKEEFEELGCPASSSPQPCDHIDDKQECKNAGCKWNKKKTQPQCSSKGKPPASLSNVKEATVKEKSGCDMAAVSVWVVVPMVMLWFQI